MVPSTLNADRSRLSRFDWQLYHRLGKLVQCNHKWLIFQIYVCDRVLTVSENVWTSLRVRGALRLIIISSVTNKIMISILQLKPDPRNASDSTVGAVERRRHHHLCGKMLWTGIWAGIGTNTVTIHQSALILGSIWDLLLQFLRALFGEPFSLGWPVVV